MKINGVLGIIINSNNQILLTKRTDIPIWCLPGGNIEYRENPKKAIIREIFEETGFKVKIVKINGVYERMDFEHVRKDNKQFTCQVFTCKILKSNFKPNGEVSKIKFFDMSRLPYSLMYWQRDIIRDVLTKRKKIVKMNLKMELIKLFLHPYILYKIIRWKIKYN